MTGLALLFGLWLTTTIVVIFIVAPYCHGHNLLRQSTLPPLSKTHTLYTSTERDAERADAYSEWVRFMAKWIKCGIDCLFYPFDPKSLTSSGKESGDVQVIRSSAHPAHDVHKLSSVLCNDIPLSERFDCLPIASPTQEKCVARGCCWKEVLEVRVLFIGLSHRTSYYLSLLPEASLSIALSIYLAISPNLS